MFIKNKYYYIYYRIIQSAKNRSLDGYYERHHIIPKSLGGNNKKCNIVDLTAREHFLCHQLLTKFTEGENKSKMIWALSMMCSNNHNQKRYSPNSKTYQIIRESLAVEMSKKFKGKKKGPLSDEVRKKISKSLTGRAITWAEKLKGPKSIEHKKAMRDNHADFNGVQNPFYGKNHSEESKKKIADRYYPKGNEHHLSRSVQINGQIFESIDEASKILKIHHSTISDVLKGRTKKSKKVIEAFYLD